MDNIFTWFIEKFNKQRVSVHAAQVAFFIIISLFPFMMFFITLMRYTPVSEDVVFSLLKEIAPGELGTILSSWLTESYHAASGTVLSVTVLTTLWAGSKGFSSIAFELDQIYEVPNRRSLLARRLLSLFYTIVFTLMILISLIFLVYGNQIIRLITHFFPALSDLELLFFVLRSGVSFFVFVLYFLCLYCMIPNRRSRMGNELPGSLFSAFLWILFSYLYSLYIDSFSNFTSVYGSLSYMVLLMLWMYFCIIIIFLGAMLNRYLATHKKLNLLRSIREIHKVLTAFRENKM